VRVLGSGAFELDLDDARARPIRERRTEVIEEDLELRDTSGARERERREKALTGEGRERRYRRPVGPDRFATREDRLPHTGSDRILDRDWIRETLISQQRYVPVEVTDRSSTDAAANECIALVRDAAQAITRARCAERHRSDRLGIDLRDVDDRRRVRTRGTLRVEQRGAHRPDEPLACRGASFRDLRRLRVPRSKEHRRGDGRPSAKGILNRRFAEDQVGVSGVESEHSRARPRGRGMGSQPRDQVAHGAVELQPDVHLPGLRGVRTASAAGLRGVRTAGAVLFHAQRRAVRGRRVEPAARHEDLERAEHEQIARGRLRQGRLDRA